MINKRPTSVDSTPVILIKSTGRRYGFDDIESAYAVAEAYDRIECMNGAHAVAAELAAKSNVTVNVLPGATVTFADKITIGTGITNFRIVGEGNLVFTGRAFELTGIVGAGNKIDVRGDVTIGERALYLPATAIQTQMVEVIGNNVSAVGVSSEMYSAAVEDSNGAQNISCRLKAHKVLTVPTLTVLPPGGGSGPCFFEAGEKIVLSDVNALHTNCGGGSGIITVITPKLEMGVIADFADPDANGSYFILYVDEIVFTSEYGIRWRGTDSILIFKKFVKIKNQSAANPAHVLQAINDALGMSLEGGAVLYTAGGGTSKAIFSPEGLYVSFGNVYGNRPCSDDVYTAPGLFTHDDALVL